MRRPMLVKVLAGLFLLLVLWALFRFAMGLRFSRETRDAARRLEESRGRRVLAEIPGSDGAIMFFLEDDRAFYWGESDVRKQDICGARMLLNGGVIGSFTIGKAVLPEPPTALEFEGRERWDVFIYLLGGGSAVVPCGTLREGVSREVAERVFGGVRRAVLAEAKRGGS